jgi:hypothetical protein
MRVSSLVRGLLFCVVVLAGCETAVPADEDAGGVDSGGGDVDSGTPTVDGGHDAGSDAGPSCTTGCTFVELALGSQFSCGRRENGEVRCWGRGMEGQLGDGSDRHIPRCPISMADFRDCSSRPVSVDLPGPVSGLTAGAYSACAIDEMDDVQCWGQEGWRIGGELAAIRLRPEAFPTFDDQAQVADGSILLCSIDNAGGLECSGLNFGRQTGTAMLTADVALPAPVMLRGDGKGTVDRPITGVLEVAVGQSGAPFACARTATQVFCWGSDSAGQLGTGADYDNCTVPDSLETFDCVEYAEPLDMLDGSMVTQLALGGNHTCALMSDGTVQCWGGNRAGQLGTPFADGEERATPLAVPGLSGVTQIAAGSNHTCALLDSGEVRCWGFNRLGQLGDADADHGTSCTLSETNVGDCSDAPVTVAGVSDATYLAAGSQHTCVIRAGGTEVWCWGLNDMLQLGNGPNRTPTGAELGPSNTPVMVIGL